MLKINTNEHCSFNRTVRSLFHKKQRINNAINYTDEEKKKIINEIENDIFICWNNVKQELKKSKG